MNEEKLNKDKVISTSIINTYKYGIRWKNCLFAIAYPDV